MKKVLLFIFVTLTMFFSCSEPLCGCFPFDTPTYVKAIVTEESNLDCGKPTITIDPEHAVIVRQIIGSASDTYIADQLADSLIIANKKIFIAVRKLGENEEFACTMVGPTYPHLRAIHGYSRQ